MMNLTGSHEGEILYKTHGNNSQVFEYSDKLGNVYVDIVNEFI